jgi:hypothetical protein
MENGKWRMENGEWRMENGEWRMENGEWRMENGEWRMENGANTRAAPATHTSRVETIPLGCRLLLIASTRAVLVVRVTIVVTAFSILHSPFSILFYAVSLRDTGNVQRSGAGLQPEGLAPIRPE